MWNLQCSLLQKGSKMELKTHVKRDCFVRHDNGLIFTSNRISRLFLSGAAAGGIEKMRSIFFQKTKSSGVPVIPPGGGTGSEAKATRQKECVQYIKV